MIYLRNLDPHRTAYVPVAPGWARLVPPQAAARVPAAVLRHAAVQHGLAAERLAVVTEVNREAGARAAAELRRDMALAIAQAEQREFDRLLQPLRLKPRRKGKGRYQPWTPERRQRFEALWHSGASLAEIAAAVGLAKPSVLASGYQLGLPRRRGLCQEAGELASRPA